MAACRQAAWVHLPLVVILGVYWLGAYLTFDSLEVNLSVKSALSLGNVKVFGPAILVLLLFYGYYQLTFRPTGERRAQRIKRWLGQVPWLELPLLRLLIPIFLLSVLQTIFFVVKPQIPAINPFEWDQYFAQLDRALFFGADPWVISHLVFTTPAMTKMLDLFYTLWFYVVVLAWFLTSAQRLDSVARLGFLLSLALGWAIPATVLAMMFSSAGPVYYEGVLGDPIFVPLVERLAEQDAIYSLGAVQLHEHLWLGYTDPDVQPMGISAFPSMHLYMIVIVACAGFHYRRWMGWLLTCLSAMIFIGSVHLAWHYAVDSIAGVVLALVLWFGCRRFSEWWIALAPAAALAPEPQPAIQTA